VGRILLALFVVFMALFVVVSFSRANLSDNETASGNSFTAGTLSITDGSSTLVPFDVGDLKPGNHVSKIFNLRNGGSVAISKLTVNAVNLVGDAGLIDQLGPAFPRDLLGSGQILPGDFFPATVNFDVPATIGPEWQGKTVQFDLEFNAEQ
jgi:hypothetical protein